MTTNKRTLVALLLAMAVFPACSEETLNEVRSVQQAQVGLITISGRVVDANGFGLGGVDVTLAGSSWNPSTADADGYYSFTGLASGSYSVRVTVLGCQLSPDVVNMNNLDSSVEQNFSAYGENCGGELKINSGAMDGAFTLSGHVTDGVGNPIVGQKIRLNGSLQAVRFTDISGGYAFHLNSGSYSINNWGSACSLAPQNANLNNLNADTVQDFVGSGSGCAGNVGEVTNQTATGQVVKVPDGIGGSNRTIVSVKVEGSEVGALERLDLIAGEQPGAEDIQISAYPAIQRIARVRGTKIVMEVGFPVPEVIVVTVAVAVGESVIRFETHMSETATDEEIGKVLALGRNFNPANVELITTVPPAAIPSTVNAVGSVPTQAVNLNPSAVTSNNGEVAVAASDVNGAVVIGTSDGPYFSSDSGSTVAESTLNTVANAGGVAFNGVGDPEVAVGAPDGNGNQAFYLSMLSSVAGGNPPTVAMAVFNSVDNGATFNPTVMPYPVDCSTDPNCIVPDQEMLAADRRNRAIVGGVSGDQLYTAWRDASITAAGGVSLNLAVACSADSGATWTIDRTTMVGTGADFPRISVAPNGDFLVSYGVFSGKPVQVMLQKWTSCAAGFQPQIGFPTLVANTTNPADMSGMPRQPSANYSVSGLASATSGSTLFVAYATEMSPGNEDIVVATSWDGGLSWPANTVINQASVGHRYFPSICSTGATAHVTWFDRRAGTAPGASNDLTGYYRSSLLNSGTTLGTEFNVSTDGFEDPQCLTGFPGGAGTSTTAGETLCTNLPNVVYGNGQCQAACPAGSPAGVPCGTLAACDFRATTGTPGACATAGETCSIPAGAVSRGSPKYGDYVVTDCAQNRVFMAWAAGSAPGGGCQGGGFACTAGDECCSGHCSSAGTCNGNPGCLADGDTFVSGGATCCSGGATWSGTATVCDASTCAGNSGVCTGNGDCCSGSCQGGLCAPVTQIYTQSTSCIGDVPTDLTCGTSAPPQAPPLYVGLAGNDTSQLASYPWQLCGDGSGFTPGGEVTMTMLHPNQSAAPISVGLADASGEFSFDEDFYRTITCSEDEYFFDTQVIFSDVASGRTFEVTFNGVPGCWQCLGYLPDDGGAFIVGGACGSSFGGGCR